MLIYEELTHEILAAAIEVHKELGPGLLESAYEECLSRELGLRGIKFDRQVPLPINYKSCQLSCGYRLDVVVENKVLLELKSVEEILPLHQAQLLTYLRLSGHKVGFLMSFNTVRLMDGVIRMAL